MSLNPDIYTRGKHIIVRSSYFSKGRKLLSQMDVNCTGIVAEKPFTSSGKENVLVAKLLIGFALPLLNGQSLGQGTNDDVKADCSFLIEW